VRVGLPQRYMFTAMALIRLELVALIRRKLEPIGYQQGILQSDQTKEDADDHRQRTR